MVLPSLCLRHLKLVRPSERNCVSTSVACSRTLSWADTWRYSRASSRWKSKAIRSCLVCIMDTLSSMVVRKNPLKRYRDIYHRDVCVIISSIPHCCQCRIRGCIVGLPNCGWVSATISCWVEIVPCVTVKGLNSLVVVQYHLEWRPCWILSSARCNLETAAPDQTTH